MLKKGSRPRRRAWEWVLSPRTTRQEEIPGVESTSYALNTLADARLLSPRAVDRFRTTTQLADFGWRVFWPRRLVRQAGDQRVAMGRAEGLVVFVHGWNGSHAIWESLPALVCAANPRLVALAPDVNGFGGSLSPPSFLTRRCAIRAC